MRKYHNSKVRIGNLAFDSKLESEHYLLLTNRLKRGEIKDLARQVKIELTQHADKHKDKVHYIADFVFFDLALNRWIVWDSKGMPTDAYKIKRKWLLDVYCGFVFVEATKDKHTNYEARGSVAINFK